MFLKGKFSRNNMSPNRIVIHKANLIQEYSSKELPRIPNGITAWQKLYDKVPKDIRNYESEFLNYYNIFSEALDLLETRKDYYLDILKGNQEKLEVLHNQGASGLELTCSTSLALSGVFTVAEIIDKSINPDSAYNIFIGQDAEPYNFLQHSNDSKCTISNICFCHGTKEPYTHSCNHDPTLIHLRTLN